MANFLPYCLDILRNTDRDRYISVLFAPKQKRRALAALYAFNAEIARIRESVRDPLMGEIRLRWWRDSIANDEQQNSESNPILNDLLKTITLFKLSKITFLHYCDARIFDLYNNPIATIHDLEAYCSKTASTILQLSCQILDFDVAPNFTDAYKYGGIAQALSGILRLLPLMQLRYQCYFPTDMLEALGISREELNSNCINDKQKQQIIEAMVALSRDYYLKFYDYSVTLPKTLKPAFLPLAVTPASLQKTIQLGAKVFQENTTSLLLYRYWLITKAAISGHFPKLF
ncbi:MULTISPECIES: phytoene/squalene synthase family protein [unclassified Bartonella]|uniref:phytoene/squalene synthase family protein n=1 Tax=Bartonella TaxID=773 RepID=UPI000998F2BD|nr:MULTISPECIES: phytoene/squalene synthase family protein [unclassified Bartonella]AQX22614.1 phytoene synthase [Bartonella sp. 11B]AQX24103.1 phytoene synthase [Bartonella sp. 114]AQX25063.1 phytoene synthase [Bartonella sp. Coyote22sub2]